jgi:hypothetical protein
LLIKTWFTRKGDRNGSDNPKIFRTSLVRGQRGALPGFYELLKTTESNVDWAYQIWDDLLCNLSHKDNHVRAIAAQLLCNLARSNPQHRMRTDFPAILEVTRDARFVNARHTLQVIWKVGTAGEAQRKVLLQGLTTRFHKCAAEKNTTLIRYDIIVGLKHLYDQTGEEAVRYLALDLIDSKWTPHTARSMLGFGNEKRGQKRTSTL